MLFERDISIEERSGFSGDECGCWRFKKKVGQFFRSLLECRCAMEWFFEWPEWLETALGVVVIVALYIGCLAFTPGNDYLLPRLLLGTLLFWGIGILFFYVTSDQEILLYGTAVFMVLALLGTAWTAARWRTIVLLRGHGQKVEARVEALGSSYSRVGRDHFIRYSYMGEGQKFHKKEYYDPARLEPEVGSTVSVAVDPRRPKRAMLRTNLS